MEAHVKGNTLVIEIEMFDPPRPSRSGKTRLIATVGSCARTDVIIDCQPVYVCLNAFIYPEPKGESNG